jgi:hypothetical protein
MAHHCPECGFLNAEGANYCQKCGAFIGTPEPPTDPVTATYRIDETGDLIPVELEDVVAGDERIAPLAFLAQAVDELGAQDVDFPVQDAPLVGDLVLLGREVVDHVLQLLVAEGPEIGKGVLHRAPNSRRRGLRLRGCRS